MLTPLTLMDGTGTVHKHSELDGTLLDPKLRGKDVTVSFSKLIPAGLLAWDRGAFGKRVFQNEEGAIRFTEVVVPPSIRAEASVDWAGNIKLTPMLIALNALIEATTTASVTASFDRFIGAYAEHVTRVLTQKVGRVRVPVSGNLVAVPLIASDAFRPNRFAQGDLGSDLRPGEIGLPSKVLDRLNNSKSQRVGLEDGTTIFRSRRSNVAAGDYVLFSRWPITDVLPGRVVEITGKRRREFCAYVSTEAFTINAGKACFQMGALEGDTDGDTLNFNVVASADAKAELARAHDVFAAQVTHSGTTPVVLTWKDHVDREYDEEGGTKDAIEQNTWISSLSNLMYAGEAVIARATAREKKTGVAPPVSLSEWTDALTTALEMCFDKKHNNASDPRPLYGVLRGKAEWPWARAEALLEAQGLDVEVIRRMVAYLNGGDIVKAANKNAAFAIQHGKKFTPPVMAFLARVPAHLTSAVTYQRMLVPETGE